MLNSHLPSRITIKPIGRLLTALAVLLLLAGCSSSSSIQINSEFPTVLAQPKAVSATVVFDDNFANYVAQPNKNTRIDFGSAQVRQWRNAFIGLFQEVEFVNSRQQVSQLSSLVVTPSVREVQVSTPSDNYLNVFEVWIKYNLDIETTEGEPIDSWFMPAYGKTPDSFMLSKPAAIEQATITALRDAGAKLIVDFYRIPAVSSWMREQQQREKSP